MMPISIFFPQQDIKPEVNMGTMQRSLPMDPSSIYGQGGMQSKPGIANAGVKSVQGKNQFKDEMNLK